MTCAHRGPNRMLCDPSPDRRSFQAADDYIPGPCPTRLGETDGRVNSCPRRQPSVGGWPYKRTMEEIPEKTDRFNRSTFPASASKVSTNVEKAWIWGKVMTHLDSGPPQIPTRRRAPRGSRTKSHADTTSYVCDEGHMGNTLKEGGTLPPVKRSMGVGLPETRIKVDLRWISKHSAASAREEIGWNCNGGASSSQLEIECSLTLAFETTARSAVKTGYSSADRSHVAGVSGHGSPEGVPLLVKGSSGPCRVSTSGVQRV